MPMVSIVLPVYNGERYIRESVESILAQSFKDWELILVDDCSADGSAEILDEYASGDNRICVIHNAVNQNLPRALNIGFAEAQGEYLTWTSDDNRFLTNAIEVMTEYLEKHENAVMVRGGSYIINERGERIGESQPYSNRDMYVWNCLGACFLYRRTVLDQVGGYHPDTYGVEDYDYWLRILNKFGSIDSIDEKLYEYRRHSESLSITKREMVLDELTKLRKKYWDKIFCVLQDNRAKLCCWYYEMLATKTFDSEFRNVFLELVPELRGDFGNQYRKPFMIFGAGIYGGRAAKFLGDQAACFVDNNPEKTGRTVCGKKILSFQDALAQSDIYDFFVAVGGAHIYDILKQLNENGVSEYAVMQSYVTSIPVSTI